MGHGQPVMPGCRARLTGLAAAVAPAAPADDTLWHDAVQPGDTLINIAARHLVGAVEWSQLAHFNQLSNPRRLQPGSALRIPLAWLRRDPAAAEVIHVRGLVRRVAADPAAPPLVVGDRLQPGDWIESAADGSATLRFVDGSRLLITPGSRINLDRLRQHPESRSAHTRVRIDSGSAETQVNPQTLRRPGFEIQTPTVNPGVRGTEFRAHAGDGVSRVEVLSGSVAAGAADAVTVNAGFGTVANAGVPIQPPTRLAAAPDLAAVAGQQDQLPLRLAWPDVLGAQGYRVQVFATQAPGGLLLDSRVPGPAAGWDSLAAAGRYRLRLQVLDADGDAGPWGASQWITRQPSPWWKTMPAAWLLLLLAL